MDQSPQRRKACRRKMNSRIGRQQIHTVRLPKTTWRKAEVSLKDARECLLRSISSVEGNTGYRPSACLQMKSRPLEPEPANVVHDRLSNNRSKDPMEVVLREAGDHSQSMGRQLV